MHIKKISIRNFKSFAKRVEIPVYEGFTVISGPNGSGKSNIIDSVLFCLGLSHSTKLRADRLTDLVYSGNGSAGGAEVSIVFDNSDGKIPSEPEIEITRKIRLTEKGYYSYYYINGKSANLSEVHRLLSHAGIYGDTYNVIMQGDVTRITEMTPVQRRKIIDDIAGISEFDEKKEKAIEELEKVRENMNRIETILNEVSTRLKQLERDKDEALRYKMLTEKKKEYEVYLKAHRYRNLLNRKNNLKKEIERVEKLKDDESRKLIELENSIQKLTSEASEISNKIAEKTDETYQQIQNKIIEVNSEIEGIKNSREFFENELKRLKDEKTGILLDTSKLKDELEKVENELEKLLMQKISISEIVGDLETRVELTKSKLQEVDTKFQKMKDDLLSIKEETEKIKEKKSLLVREQDKKLETIRRIGIEIEDLEKEEKKQSSLVSEMEKEIEELRSQIDKKEKELEKHIKRRNEIDSLLFNLRNQLSALEEELKSKEVEVAKVKAKISALRPFSKSVELVLEAKQKKALPGVYGTVSQLGEVNEQYMLAVEIAAGNALQFIVVENEDDAIRAINYLKQVRGGRATFLPLNKIMRKIELKELPRDDEIIDYAINLVRFDKKFRPVFEFVFGDTVVVDNIQTAKRLMNGRRIVTLEGDLIEKSGSMTGGSSDGRKGLLLSRELIEKEKELMEEITILNSKKAGIVGDIRTNEQTRREVQSEIEKIEKIINELNSEISVSNSRLEDASSRISDIEEKLKEKIAERERLYNEMSELEKEIKDIDSDIQMRQKSILEIENALKGSKIPQLTSELDRLKDELARNRQVLISVEKKIENTEFRKEQIEKTKKEKEEYLARIEKTENSINQKLKEGKGRIESLRNELENLRVEEEKVGEEVKELREKRDKLLEEIRIKEQEKQRSSFNIVSLEEKIKAKNEAVEEIESEIKEIGEIVVEDLPSSSRITEELQEIEKKLAEFGDVNLKAIQEYEEVKARKEELVERNLTLGNESREILKRIEKYESMKRGAFFNAFNAVSRNFSEIIHELTGGEGELYLDSDDPFSSGMHIKVKIHNKSPQKLDSMSGGEKSLVALALIFAIQQYKPAPFYAFDEIDMFLDGVNVSRVAKMIKEKSKNAQFVVVSLRKPMLEKADSIIGVTLGRDNSSLVTGIKMRA
ncbi:MAG TPA: chromosome segregation protein SMC [Archaeoglobaceae archaeon]|nr:chromosome segregation protein SMC [Archaeoglobaceae archaeon]